MFKKNIYTALLKANKIARFRMIYFGLFIYSDFVTQNAKSTDFASSMKSEWKKATSSDFDFFLHFNVFSLFFTFFVRFRANSRDIARNRSVCSYYLLKKNIFDAKIWYRIHVRLSSWVRVSILTSCTQLNSIILSIGVL